MKSTTMRTWIAALLAVFVLAVLPADAQQPPPAQAPASAPQPTAPPADEAQQPPASNGAKPAPTGEVPAQIAEQIARLSASVEAAEKSLERIKDSDTDLARLRGELDQGLAETAKIAEQIRPLLAAAQRQVESLGPAPAKDAPPETAAIAAERERLGTIRSALDGALKTIDLTDVRARELIRRLTETRQSLFARNLFERARSPLMPYHWRLAARDLPTTSEFSRYIANDWLESARNAMP